MKSCALLLELLFALLLNPFTATSQSNQFLPPKDSFINNDELQDKFAGIDFRSSDSFAKTVKYENGLFPMTNILTQKYSSQIEKLRSIFIWITENIKYDCDFLNKDEDPPSFECEGDSISCADGLSKWEMEYINKVLKKKRTICQGYSMLLKKMCDISGIECEIISGYAKNKSYQVGIPFIADHAWNAVRIDSVYYFLDATWAAGFCPLCIFDDDLYCEFVKSYKNYYWLTPFNKLVRDHYPSNGKWVMEPNYTKEKFFDNAFFYGQYALEHIDILSPNTGVIEAKVGDTIHFKFTYTGPEINKMQINSNIWRNPSIDYYETYGNGNNKRRWVHDTLALKKQVYLPFRKTHDLYEVDYIVTNSALYVIDILFEHAYAMRFKVKIKE
jgi:hypothetical protein